MPLAVQGTGNHPVPDVLAKTTLRKFRARSGVQNAVWIGGRTVESQNEISTP